MDQGKDLLEIIIKIIHESEIQDIQDLVIETKPYKNSKNFKDFLNFEHRTHNGFSIKLKNCQNSHCIECLFPSLYKICSHGQKLTSYEYSLLDYLISQLNMLKEVKVLYKKCKVCLETFDSECLSLRSCPCFICDSCLVSQYRFRKIYCEYCKTKFDCKKLEKIGEKIEVNVEILEECSKCGLVYEYSSLLNQVCLLCEQKN